MQQMRFVDSYALNKNVFSLFLNVSNNMSGLRNSAGKLFHWEVFGQRSQGGRSSCWYVEQSVERCFHTTNE